jgi:putative membrane protein
MLRNAYYGVFIAVLAGTALAGTALVGTANPALAQSPQITDGQILNYVQTVNKGEIADAKMALKRTKSGDVKSFAQAMIADHSNSEKTISQLARKNKIKPASSDFTKSLKKEAQDGDKQLKSKKGADFDKQYAQDEDKMHGEVADTIQNQLTPAASNDQVKSALADTLNTVRQHQQAAHDLQSKL